MMTRDYIEHQFCEYMFVQKWSTRRDIDLKIVCRKMGGITRSVYPIPEREPQHLFQRGVA